MSIRRRDFIKVTTALAAGSAFGADALHDGAAWAQDKGESLLAVLEGAPNSLDFHVPGANRQVYEVVWNIYDRLLTFGVKKDANGNDYYDVRNLQPELAEEWDLRDTSVTLKLRKDATFADGTPVTAKDVKWAFDRTLGVGGYPRSAVAAASLVRPDQFVAVDDHTFRVDFVNRDKLSMPYLGVPLVNIYHSELVKKHATPADPWGIEWTKFNHAGSGAYKVEKWTPGQEIVYVRHDNWKSGPLPKLRRVISRVVPSAGMRRAMVQRADVDVSFDITP
jgi:peptide/nickel transport system substrate-binding protein